MKRDASIDAARAVAIAGVVGGHWLVTGLVVNGAGAWRQASPLSAMPVFTPISWLLQTLGLFFFTAGFAAAARSASTRRQRPALSSPHPCPPRLFSLRLLLVRQRSLTKLAVPVAVLLSGWTLVLLAATLLGMPAGTRHTIMLLVVSPLWFLLPYLALTFATGPLCRAVDRAGPFTPIAPAVMVVALSDAGLVPEWAAIGAAWSVPWVLGVAMARRGRRALPATGLLIGGITTIAILVLALGYPASAVGVPGDGRSNLSPPSLFAVALAAAQIGLFLLIRDAASRRAERRRLEAVDAAAQLSYPTPNLEPTQCPGGGGGGAHARTSTSKGLRRGAATMVGSLNRAALPIYLTHQTVLVTVVAGAAAIWPAPVKGLLTPPTDPQWIFARLAWLPFLALVLAAVVRVAWPTTRLSGRLKTRLSSRLQHGPNDQPRPTEVIAVRDSDPPSRGRAARQRS
jgi:hypothetical protein